jgi:ATP-dependent Lon protease
MGVGKTTIIKNGISKILNRPFSFVALGGANDGTYLNGHSYTYEGSTYGKIMDIVIQSKVLNPVIFFDELDKVSQSEKGNEIIGILTHLTDSTQNSEYQDNYFSEISIDMSKSLFVFSFNDETLVNPILKDRMKIIDVKGYDKKDKVIISKKHLLPELMREYNFTEKDIIFNDEIIEYIIDKTTREDGVRNLKRSLESIISKINLIRIKSNLYEGYVLDKNHIDEFINNTKETNKYNMMYL